MHPAASLLAVVALLLLAHTIRGRRAQVLLVLLGTQLVLGVADVLALAPLTLQVLHLLGADLLWIALIAVASECLLPAVSARASLAFESSATPHTSLRPGQA
jgi:cytochrome c oxidase assembly protein subunit 15